MLQIFIASVGWQAKQGCMHSSWSFLQFSIQGWWVESRTVADQQAVTEPCSGWRAVFLKTEAQNHSGCKRPQRSQSPGFDQSPPWQSTAMSSHSLNALVVFFLKALVCNQQTELMLGLGFQYYRSSLFKLNGRSIVCCKTQTQLEREMLELCRPVVSPTGWMVSEGTQNILQGTGGSQHVSHIQQSGRKKTLKIHYRK